MNHKTIASLAILFSVSVFNLAQAADKPTGIQTLTPQKIPPKYTLNKPATQCPDPAVVDFIIRPNGRNTNGTYNMHISPVIKNVGRVAYVAGITQQNIVLKHGSRVLQADKWRTANLAPGATTSASGVYYMTTWNPNPGEFAANITATITYDPDIRLDGNTSNDDCRSTNNSKTLTVRQINRKLHIRGF